MLFMSHLYTLCWFLSQYNLDWSPNKAYEVKRQPAIKMWRIVMMWTSRVWGCGPVECADEELWSGMMRTRGLVYIEPVCFRQDKYELFRKIILCGHISTYFGAFWGKYVVKLEATFKWVSDWVTRWLQEMLCTASKNVYSPNRGQVAPGFRKGRWSPNHNKRKRGNASVHELLTSLKSREEDQTCQCQPPKIILETNS